MLTYEDGSIVRPTENSLQEFGIELVDSNLQLDDVSDHLLENSVLEVTVMNAMN